MLVITIILAVYVICSPFLLREAFLMGVKVSKNEPIETPKKKKKKSKPNISKEEQADLDFMENIENYNGIGSKQKVIKR